MTTGQGERPGMFLVDLRSALRTYWYLVVAGIVVTLLLGWLTLTSISATYTARANVMLLPPESSVEPGGNPYLYLGGLDEALDVLVRTLSTENAKDEVLGGGGGGYEIVRDQSTSGPIILIEATGDSSEEAQGTLQELLRVLPSTLDGLQADLDVAPQSRISTQLLAVDDEADVSQKTRAQAVGVVIGAGIAGTVLATGLVAGLRESRRRHGGGKHA